MKEGNKKRQKGFMARANQMRGAFSYEVVTHA